MKRLVLLLMVVAATLSFLPGVAQRPSKQQQQEMEEQLKKFNQFYFYLNAMYVDTLDNENLVERAIVDMLSDLDPHSAYITAEDMKAEEESMQGSFSGIGIEFDILNDTITVVNTIAGGPSAVLGVQPNDKIIEVDGVNAIGVSKTDVRKMLRGEKGSIVTVKIVRRGMLSPLNFKIVRDEIPITTVDAAYRVTPKTGYIKVNRFAHTTMEEFEKGMEQIGEVENLILDLRGNSGGLLNQAIEMSEYFLSKDNVIVSTEGRMIPTTEYYSERDGKFKGKVAVLTDAASASGSEIVAGALQDWDRGVIIGRTTFGKGLVQRQIDLFDGSAVRITIARYHTPSGRVIQRPFENGDASGYYADHLKRSYDQKYRDSVNMNAPQYKTLRLGRTVYGSGGISPDVEIAIDTTANYAYWNRLVTAGLVNEYVNKVLEEKRDRFARQYPDFDTFSKKFSVDEKMMDGLQKLGEKNNIKIEPTDDMDFTKKCMTIHLKALFAQKLWDTTEYYKIINQMDDEEFKAALELLETPGQYESVLSKTAQ
ncbi:MAG: S41 family peptidase [Tidjanibacter sp.]|nr:S41 family peptidase [Tidjanibacter sp.]